MRMEEYSGKLYGGKPEECPGNGKTLTEDGTAIFECCCDECDFFLDCYPEYIDQIE